MMKTNILIIAIAILCLCLSLLFLGEKFFGKETVVEKNQGLVFDDELQKYLDQKDWLSLTATVSSKKEQSLADKVALSRAQLESGFFNEALKLSEKIMEEGERGSFVRHVRVWALLYGNKLDEAELQIMSWLKQEKENGDAHHALGHCLWQRKKLKEASDQLSQALKYGCHETKEVSVLLMNIYWQIGVDYRESKNYLKAAEYMSQSVALEPEQANYYLNLGKMYVMTKQYEKALNTLHQGLTKEMEAKVELAIFDEIRLIHHKRATNALLEKKYEKAIVEAREEKKYSNVKSHTYAISKFIENAISLYVKELRQKKQWEELSKYKPKDPETRWELSRKLPENERWEIEKELIPLWESELYRRRALDFWEAGQKKQACKWMIRHAQLSTGRVRMNAEILLFQWVRALYENDDELDSLRWKKVGKLFKMKKGSAEWLAQISEVNRLFPQRYFIWLYEAEVLLEMGNIKGFNELATQIESLDPPEKSMGYLKQLRERSLLPR